MFKTTYTSKKNGDATEKKFSLEFDGGFFNTFVTMMKGIGHFIESLVKRKTL